MAGAASVRQCGGGIAALAAYPTDREAPLLAGLTHGIALEPLGLCREAEPTCTTVTTHTASLDTPESVTQTKRETERERSGRGIMTNKQMASMTFHMTNTKPRGIVTGQPFNVAVTALAETRPALQMSHNPLTIQLRCTPTGHVPGTSRSQEAQSPWLAADRMCGSPCHMRRTPASWSPRQVV